MRRLFFLLILLVALGGASPRGFAVEKIIRKPIVTDYGVADAAFTNTINGLLRPGLVGGNKVEALLNGDGFFPPMLEAIRKAEKSVTFENFIWRSGKISDEFIEALTAAARRGVKAHCIVDGFGASKLERKDRKRLREAGVQLEIYNPIRIWNPWEWNYRTHRKTLVVDGKVAFIGGLCIADSWTGNAQDVDHWRETEFRMEGPVVADIQGIFMDNWTRVRSEVLHGPDYFPELPPAGEMLAQAFKSGPVDGAENARLLYLYSIAAARKSIRLTHSYMVPDNLAIEMLVDAAKRGVKIEIITPGHIDMNVVRRAARSRWDKMMDAGITFYEYQPSKLHTKVMIVDDIWVTCGSVNFDDRSFRINAEGNANVYDAAFAKKQIEIFEADKAKSVHIEPKAFKKRSLWIRCVEGFCALFRGQL